MNDDNFMNLRENIQKQKEIVKQIDKNPEKVGELSNNLRKTNEKLPTIVNNLSMNKLLPKQNIIEEEEVNINPPIEEEKIVEKRIAKKFTKEEIGLEKEVLKRIKGKEKKIVVEKVKEGPGFYTRTANKIFSRFSIKLHNQGLFKGLKKDLVQANLSFLPISYISIVLLTTLISLIFSFFIFGFFMLFNLTITVPFIQSYQGAFLSRFLQVFWVLIVIPALTFWITYSYPSIEKGSIKGRIDNELPFVVIHMSAIAGSMIEPSKIFEIITSIKEYPATSKEFKKVINEINIYGYDLVNALRESAEDTSSDRLKELYNGLATTITSGGNLQRFFDKRSQSLLFDYKLERERYTRVAETFMDIYISVVIAAPMILMLLLMMIKISGLGISISANTITLIMVLGVSLINVAFIIFLNFKQPKS
ncbi:MAG: type II secretion system F family protein [archaeon]|nr:type II secretion system F family protein [archaeon]